MVVSSTGPPVMQTVESATMVVCYKVFCVGGSKRKECYIFHKVARWKIYRTIWKI